MNFFRPKPSPAPEPYNPHRWVERCCTLLKTRYCQVMPSGKVCDLATLMILYRALLKEHLG